MVYNISQTPFDVRAGVEQEGYCKECYAIMLQTNVFASYLKELINTNVESKVEKYKYGYKGEVSWFTKRDKTIQRISSINLDSNERFKALFEIQTLIFENNVIYK